MRSLYPYIFYHALQRQKEKENEREEERKTLTWKQWGNIETDKWVLIHRGSYI